MSVTNDQKTELLFKQFNNVVNAGPSNSFSTTTVNKFPFRNYVANEEIFSNNIPPNLSNVTYTIGPTTLYGVEALDISNEIASSPNGTVYPIPNTDLTFYYRLPLTQATFVTARTWFKDDGTGQNNSILRDSIPFNYDPSLNSYQPKLFPLSSGTQIPIFSSNQGNLFWLLDYKSGFVEFYGTTSDINTWVSTNTQPRISFIKYTGPKGASGGGGGGGGDASFNNVDISGDLTVANLTVTDSAELPKDTLIQPIFYRLAGSFQSNNAFFDKEYAQTQSYNAILADPSINLITDSDWITIARVAEPGVSNEDGRADALFKISHPESGRHETITFIASFKFGNGMSINVLQHDWYSGPNLKALRIGYNGLYNGAVLQLQFTSNLAFGRDNPLAIYIKDDHDYPGWEHFTDTAGTPKLIDGLLVPYATPNNTPTSVGTTPTPLTSFFPSPAGVDITWNPSGGNANQITTNPSKFEQQVDIRETLNVNGDITVPTADVLAPAGTGLFNGLNVTNNAIVGQTLTVNDDGYVSSFEATGFQITPNPTRPYLAEMRLPFGVNNIKNTTGKALFELVVSDQDPADENSARNHVIVGTITISSTAGISSDSSSGVMINILHSAWSDRIGTPPAPLVSKIFINGQNVAGPPVSNVIYRLWIESPFSTLGYVSFKLKDNGLNTYGNHTTNFGQYWIVNSGLAGSVPSGTGVNIEVNIAEEANTNTILGADIVDIPRTLRVNNIETMELEIGDSNNKIVSQAHQITLDNSISANDWFTIAQIGPDNTSGSTSSIRGVAIIEFYNRVSSRHQVIRMFVSQIFNSGGSLEVYNVGFSGGSGLSYERVRIVSDSTYDGALLQVQAGGGIATGPTNPHFVNLMLSTNQPGWNIVDDNSTLQPDNAPVKYTGPNQGTLYNQPTQGWTEARLDSQYGYTNTQGPRAFTGKVTSLPTTFQDARVQVRGENITAWKENGFGGSIASIDGVVSIQSIGGDDLTLELDPTGDAKIGNLNSSNGKNITIESDGSASITANSNIILDNQTATNNPSGIVAFSRDGIYMQANNTGSTSNINLKTFGSNSAVNYVRLTANSGANSSAPGTNFNLTWAVNGLDVDKSNISNINGLYGFNTRTNNMVIEADNRWNNAATRPQAKAIDLNNPLTMLSSSVGNDIINNLNNQAEGTMIYHSSIGSLIVKPAIFGPAGSPTNPQILMSPTTVTLMDWGTNYSTGTNFFTTYSKLTGLWITNSSWPNNPLSSWSLPYLYNSFFTAHAGYVTAVDFGGGLPHANSEPNGEIFGITRVISQFGLRSTIDLIIRVDNLTTTTDYNVGTILEGPPALITGTERSAANQTRWRFQISPSDPNTKVTFEAGDRITFGLLATDRAQSNPDRFNVNINNLANGGMATVLSADLTLVYLPIL